MSIKLTNNKSISLVIIDTRDHDQALKTIEHNRGLMYFDEVLFLTNKDPKVDGVKYCHTPIIRSRDHYSQMMLSYVHQWLHTDLALITQTDGFIYNADAWQDEFAEYDYIGAPWWYYPFNHMPPHPPSGPRTCVGNGGFSLRSKGLMNAVHQEVQSKDWPSTLPEDIFICRTLRPILEKQGFKWAPEHLAHQFCCEDRPYANQFGVHGHQTFEINACLQKP